MLQPRSGCECCDVERPLESAQARICSFVCAFCRSCAESVFAGWWSSCGGELPARPSRPAEKMAKYPASRGCIFKLQGAEGMRHSRREYEDPLLNRRAVPPMTPNRVLEQTVHQRRCACWCPAAQHSR
jgi:hypothetical protein